LNTLTAIVSRVPIVASLATRLTGISLPGRVAFVHLDTEPATAVMAVYVPSRDRSLDKTERKSRFIASLTAALERLPTEIMQNLILGGDYNVISRNHQPRYSGFLDFEYELLETLHRNTLIDAFEKIHPGQQAHSWIGRTGDGYRYDYLHVGSKIASQITACDYLHETRDLRLTDHAAVTLKLNINAREKLDPTDPLITGTDTMALF
jgi:exodeoxyribonuclease-3